MSLQLLEGYSSEEDDGHQIRYENSSVEEYSDNEDAITKYRGLSEPNVVPQSDSALPSAHDAFAEIACPPLFLNNYLEHTPDNGDEHQMRYGNQRKRKGIKDLPAGTVLEAKAQLVGIHERVRSDIDCNICSCMPTQPKSDRSVAEKRVAFATNPTVEDAAELLRMCPTCGIPKTYSHTRGVVCPVCGDRPLPDAAAQQEKKKGSTIKEKEKSKRMKGQSSHSTWKSETEMQLRQQFD